MRRPTRILLSLPHNGGAHSAPARERRGVPGPRKRPSRGVGRSPTLVRSQRSRSRRKGTGGGRGRGAPRGGRGGGGGGTPTLVRSQRSRSRRNATTRWRAPNVG